MANVLEIPSIDGTLSSPVLEIPAPEVTVLSSFPTDLGANTLEIPSQYPTSLPANCQTCGAWFHYPKDQFGGDVPGGVWILCIVGPCGGAPIFAWANVQGNPNPNTTAGIAFSNVLNSVQTVFAAMNTYSGGGAPPITVDQVAAWCWQFNVTTLFKAQGPADGYALGCAPEPTGSPCVNGYYYDPQQETCVPLQDITGHIPILPPGQGGNGHKKTGNGTGQPGNDPELDEIGQCCVQTNANLVLIQQEIRALQNAILGQGYGQPLDPVTCTQLTGLFAQVVWQLALLGNSIGKLTGATAPLVTVNAPVTVNVPEQPPPNITVNAPPTDLTAVVTQLAAIFRTIDIKPDTIQALVNAGYLSPDAMSTIGQGDFGDALVTVIVNAGYKAVAALLGAVGITVAGSTVSVANPADTVAKDVAVVFNALLLGGDAALTPTITALTDSVRAKLLPGSTVTIGDIGLNPAGAVAAGASIALSGAAAAWLLAYAGIDEGGPLTRIAEVIAEGVDFGVLADVELGPLIRNGIGKIADMNAKAKFRQELPGTSALFGLVAQGKLDAARARALALFNGTPDELMDPLLATAYRGLNARQMLRLIETNLFSSTDIADELTFSGMRTVSQHRMLLAAPYLATASERSSLRATIESAAVAGLLSDADVKAQLDAAETNTDRDSLILAKVHLQQFVENAKALEQEYSNLYKANLIADDALRANLTAIGLQPFAVNMIAAKAEVAANVTLQKQTLAAERALERATAGKERVAAVKAYTTGTIDAAALAAALALTGLTATQAAAWESLAVLQKGGALRWLYGLQVTPPQAILLRQRVTALTDQRKRLQITDQQYVDSLVALGLGPRYVNALRAAANSTITPKTSAIVTPVQIN